MSAGHEDTRGNRRTVATMCIDRLEETERDPDVHGENVEVPTEGAVEEWTRDRASTKDHNLSGVRIFRSKAERGRVLVVNLVDVLVERAPVQCLVGYPDRVSTGAASAQTWNIPKKWNMSSKTKKNAIWEAITCHAGNGTCHVDMPNISAMGWKNQIWRIPG